MRCSCGCHALYSIISYALSFINYVIYNIHSYRCSPPPPPSSSSSLLTKIGEVDDFCMKMPGFDVRYWSPHYASTSCLAQAQCATIRMSTDTLPCRGHSMCLLFICCSFPSLLIYSMLRIAYTWPRVPCLCYIMYHHCQLFITHTAIYLE